MRLLLFPNGSDEEEPKQPPPARSRWIVPFWIIYLVLMVAFAGPLTPSWLKLVIAAVLTALLRKRGAFD